MFPLSKRLAKLLGGILLASIFGGQLAAATLCVTVRDYASLPLPNAWVNTVDLFSNKLRTVEADRAGKACFPKLKEGYYSVEAGQIGFLNVRYSPIRLTYPGVQDYEFKLPFAEIREGDMGIRKDAEAIVSGTLNSRDGPVDGATICLLLSQAKIASKCVVTNDLGEYALSLPPGVYRVEVRLPGLRVPEGVLPQVSTLDVSTPGVYRNRISLSKDTRD